MMIFDSHMSCIGSSPPSTYMRPCMLALQQTALRHVPLVLIVLVGCRLWCSCSSTKQSAWVSQTSRKLQALRMASCGALCRAWRWARPVCSPRLPRQGPAGWQGVADQQCSHTAMDYLADLKVTGPAHGDAHAGQRAAASERSSLKRRVLRRLLTFGTWRSAGSALHMQS